MRRYVKWIAPMLVGAALSAPIPALAATDAQLCSSSQIKAFGKYVTGLFKNAAKACRQQPYATNGSAPISLKHMAKVSGKFNTSAMRATDKYGRDAALGADDGDCPVGDTATLQTLPGDGLNTDFTFQITDAVYAGFCP